MSAQGRQKGPSVPAVWIVICPGTSRKSEMSALHSVWASRLLRPQALAWAMLILCVVALGVDEQVRCEVSERQSSTHFTDNTIHSIS